MMGRIFVLEDDRGWEAYYRRVLKDYELRFFNNGIEAVAAMDEEKPALVLLDVLLKYSFVDILWEDGCIEVHFFMKKYL